MEILFGGVRGSQVVAGPQYGQYGGQTTCALVTGTRGEQIVIDAGTGLANVADRLQDSGSPVLLLLSHFHLDHMLGLSGLGALYQPGRQVTMAGMAQGPMNTCSVRQAVTGFLAPPYWPMGIKDMGATIDFAEFSREDGACLGRGPGQPLVFGGLAVRACPVAHSGGCLAWRIDEPATGDALVFATDMEWALMERDHRETFLQFCRQPKSLDLLVMDGHFAPEEYDGHRGWGHSTFAEVGEVGQASGTRRLLLTHHAPQNNDAELNDRRRRLNNMALVQGLASGADLAREGQSVDVGEGRSQGPDAEERNDDSVVNEAVRTVLLMVQELHEMGYQRLRIEPGLSPSGMYWRCAVTHAGNIRRNHGARCCHEDQDTAKYTSGAGTAYFEWDDALTDTPAELARKFIERFPVIARLGRGRDPQYSQWYDQVVALARENCFPIAYSDYEQTEQQGLPTTGNPETPLPLPPGGEG